MHVFRYEYAPNDCCYWSPCRILGGKIKLVLYQMVVEENEESF